MLIKIGKKLYFNYTILFGLCTGILYIPLFLVRRGVIGNGDSFNQVYPVFIYIGKYIREVFAGSIKQFDFRIGLGDDVIGTLNYYGFGDVFSVFSALFPVEWSEIAYTIVMVLKFYLCGISFIIYSKKYLEKDYTQISGALLYVFSVFVITRGLVFMGFLNPVITFPLIIAGIDEIKDSKKKISFYLIVGLFLQSLNGFYFLYMEIILAVIYFLIISLFDDSLMMKVRLQKMCTDGLRVMFQAFLGVCGGAYILLPSIIEYLNSSRTSRSSLDSFFYDKGDYLKMIKCLIVPEAWESIVTISPIVLLGLILAFMKKDMDSKLKMVVSILVGSFCFPFVGSMMNGFSSPTDRWYFAVQMFLIIIAMISIERCVRLSNLEIIIFYFVALGLVFYNVYTNASSFGVYFRSICLILCIIGLPFVWNHTKRES